MELNPQFKDFLRNIRPSERNKEEWKRGSNTLRSRLLNDSELGPLITTTFLQGSVRRSTAVRPIGGKRSDVDVVIVTNIDYSKENPADAMKRFEPFLDRYYADKWIQQDRSFGIEMSYVDLDLVVTALPIDPKARQLLENFYRSIAVETDLSIEETDDGVLDENWNLFNNGISTSLVRTDSAEWKKDPLMLPDRPIQEWGPTHPLAQIAWTVQKNSCCNGHYINVVRAIKWWRHEHVSTLPKYSKGYPLEHMIGYVLPDGITSIAEGVVKALEGIRDKFALHVESGEVPNLPDHGVPSHNVLQRLSLEDFTDFYNQVSKAAELAKQAFEETDKDQSGLLWQELLGDCFPLPGPRGGDRTHGFTTPTTVITPKQTERFA